MDVLKPCSATGQNADNGMRGSEKSSHILILVCTIVQQKYHWKVFLMFRKLCTNVQFLLPQSQPPSYGHDRIEGTISFTPQHAITPEQLSQSFEGIDPFVVWPEAWSEPWLDIGTTAVSIDTNGNQHSDTTINCIANLLTDGTPFEWILLVQNTHTGDRKHVQGALWIRCTIRNTPLSLSPFAPPWAGLLGTLSAPTKYRISLYPRAEATEENRRDAGMYTKVPRDRRNGFQSKLRQPESRAIP